jgi:hypothetical protein
VRKSINHNTSTTTLDHVGWWLMVERTCKFGLVRDQFGNSVLGNVGFSGGGIGTSSWYMEGGGGFDIDRLDYNIGGRILFANQCSQILELVLHDTTSITHVRTYDATGK